MAKRIQRPKKVKPLKKYSMADIGMRIKIVSVRWEDQELVKGARFACEHIAEEIKAGEVTSWFSAPSQPVNHIWIATCEKCIQATGPSAPRSEMERKHGEESAARMAARFPE